MIAAGRRSNTFVTTGHSTVSDSGTYTKFFFKKIIIRMDVPHSFYDDNGIFHCNLIDLLLDRVELF